MHRQENKEQHRLAYKHPGCKQELFFFFFFFNQREEYKTALPQRVFENLYGVTTALEKSNSDANIKHRIKKLKGLLYYKAFWSPEFIKHKQNRQKGQSPFII